MHLLSPWRDTFGARWKTYLKSSWKLQSWFGDIVTHPNIIQHQLPFCLLMKQSACKTRNVADGLHLSDFSFNYRGSYEELLFSPLQQDWSFHGFQVNCDKNTNISAMHTDIKKQIIRTRLLRTNLKSRGILPFCQACTSFLPALSLLHSLLYLFITTSNYYSIVISIMPQ